MLCKKGCCSRFLIFYEFFNLDTCWLMHTCLLITMQVNGNCKVNSDWIVDIFDFSETVRQINFKLGGDVPLVCPYYAFSNCHGPVIFGFLMNFLLIFGESLKKIFFSETT